MQHRTQFIEFFFDRIKNQNYVLLKHMAVVEDYADLDVLLDPTDTALLVPGLCNQPMVENFQLQKQRTMWQLFLYFKDDSFLQIDFLFGFFRKEVEYLNQEEVREEAVEDSRNYKICSRRHLFEHVFLFSFLNHAPVPEKYRNFFAKFQEYQQNEINFYLQQKYLIPDFSFQATGQYDPAIRTQVLKGIYRQKGNDFLQRKWRLLNHYTGQLSQLWPRRGMTITFSGVDGAGKSTIIADVAEILKNKYRRKVVVLRHRPSILPILSAWRYGKKGAEERSVARLPRQGKNGSKLSSFVRFSYYYLDYLFGQIYVFCKYQLRSYIILYDRYYFDFIVDGQRSNIGIGDKLPRFLYRFIYKPKLNLFLYAHPELILSRKQELNSETILELTDKYQNLFKSLSDKEGSGKPIYLAIENNIKEETLETIFSNYKELVI